MQVLDSYQDSWRSNTLGLTVALVDVVCVLGLIVLTMGMLLWNYQDFPLQYWDESRNANNALEMVLGSSWWVPVYDGQVDHWNTKPPLLIWFIAGLMKLGVSPLLAVRLPSALAACATLVMVWASVRYVLRDRLAAVVAVSLLLSSRLYTGIHGAHTGDYDTLLALFTTGYVLSVWMALEAPASQRNRWIFYTALCLVLAVMTKGPAGLFGVVGLGLFFVVSGQLLPVLKNWRWWVAIGTAGVACAGYYLTRELYDPGYLNAVWLNEVAGRYGQTNEENFYGRWFYLSTLFEHFVPGILFLLLVVLPLTSRDLARKRLAQITFWSGSGIVILLFTAQTQLYWYLLPAIPLFSIAAALAVVDLIRKFRLRRRAIIAFAILFLLVPTLISVKKNVISIPAYAQKKVKASQYGLLFNALRNDGYLQSHLTVVDDGIDNTAGLINYNPELKFYKTLEQRKGVDVQVASLHSANALNGLVASCDYKNTAELRRLLNQVLFDNNVCVAGYKGG